jgi:hypothetical protein
LLVMTDLFRPVLDATLFDRLVLGIEFAAVDNKIARF